MLTILVATLAMGSGIEAHAPQPIMVAQYCPEARAQQQRPRNRRPSLLDQGIGMLGGAVGGAVNDRLNQWGIPTDYQFRSTLNSTLTDFVACLLNPAEREQAASATNQAITGGVGTQASWESTSRPGVSGNSTVLSQTNSANGLSCIEVRDVVIINGEEAISTKQMCRSPGQTGYQVVTA
ncbi:MAG: hypothetical protein Q8S53_01630 [Brevundimonas sp.]|uniref:hypothetical protein n=1 Tax=Brevundimonas sp. TaxID=1871086 RepID=UPI0027340385|nr:hypothetical protein [Brevundimonas sp.]MDP3377036.1 hypothetical protein [Brevundimonas sp.]